MVLTKVLARSPAVRTQAVRFPRTGVRKSSYYHFENEDGYHLPFSTKSKTGLAIKMTLFFGTGFSLPFIAGMWQFHKAGKPFFKTGQPLA
ncbi:265_t:CDS:2 [Entrophospora sp. SA101]|nr:265_t:CDS:2 [Entrophospora sp. SA101]CAJ0827424.1 940_t:CDS:2 [Entrophospora sp. SA101]CAJ0882004.1 2215_t:CDS:2 [Entrophospora sp. SA101]